MKDNALERLKRLIQAEMSSDDRRELLAKIDAARPKCEDIKVSIKDPFQRALFQRLAARYGLKVFREPRQHKSTVMVHGPVHVLDDELWPEYDALSGELHEELVKTFEAFLERKLPSKAGKEVEAAAEDAEGGEEREDEEVEVEVRQGGLEGLGAEARAVITVPMAIHHKTGEVKGLEPDEPVPLRSGGRFAVGALPPIGELYRGDVRPEGDVAESPTYVPFLASVEQTAREYVQVSGRLVSDEEFCRLYKRLKQKPDSEDQNPLFSYLQAAARAYMARNPISRAEFRAVIGRLARSAKSFRMSKRSTNYIKHALGKFEKGG